MVCLRGQVIGDSRAYLPQLISSLRSLSFDPLKQRSPKPAGLQPPSHILVDIDISASSVPGDHFGTAPSHQLYDLTPHKKFEDSSRRALDCELTPNAGYAAVADSLGRVGLYCCETLRVLHLWKGYREGVPRFLSDTHLCIYASRRGLLEVWNVARRKRVQAYNLGVSPCSVLVCDASDADRAEETPGMETEGDGGDRCDQKARTIVIVRAQLVGHPACFSTVQLGTETAMVADEDGYDSAEEG